MKKNNRPEWIPENAGDEYASIVVPPTETITSPPLVSKRKSDTLSIAEYRDGILSQNQTILARAITLVESNAEKHFDIAQELIRELLPYSGNSIRIGITGMPGAGKSSFIEKFGLFLIENERRPAILAIDPSSSITRGSILGDKTRMEYLSRSERAFIRPSPSGGNLGGVARKTKESIILCEAAGYDVILIETVGVGQNEVTVRSMVDFFLLIFIAGAGDELQGIKKGVMELADAILINKADGTNIVAAEATMNQYNNALHYLADATPGWKTTAYTCSALENKGIDNIWNVINDFIAYTKNTNIIHEEKKYQSVYSIFEDRRLQQTKAWFESLLDREILNNFYKNESVAKLLPEILNDILNQKITPVAGVKKILGDS